MVCLRGIGRRKEWQAAQHRTRDCPDALGASKKKSVPPQRKRSHEKKPDGVEREVAAREWPLSLRVPERADMRTDGRMHTRVDMPAGMRTDVGSACAARQRKALGRDGQDRVLRRAYSRYTHGNTTALKIALSRHRRRRVRCAGMGVPVLKMTAAERRSF